MKYLIIVLLSICAGIFYRSGGLSKDSTEPLSKWIPKWMRCSMMRDAPCALCCCALVPPHSIFQLIMWLCFFGATAGLLSTYWDEL
jgi:hypothetical protein